jgi:hypothetical protein
MNIQEELNRQRVKHIVDSYRLDGDESDSCTLYLQELLSHYPAPLVELALVESLVDHWLSMPMLRGTKFLAYTHRKLRIWEVDPISSTLTPAQFQQITGLDPAPVFGPQERPSPIERSS